MKKLVNISVAIVIPLFLAIFACFACRKEKMMDTTQSRDTTATGTTPGTPSGLQYLALGDSYTIGQNVPENDRFPAQTVKILADQDISIQSIKYTATTGWTTANLINAIGSQNPTPT